MSAFKYSIALAAILASSAAFADDLTVRDLSVEQKPAEAIVAPHPGTLATSIVADRPDATYAVGETIRLSLTANQESYVTVLDVGPTGMVTQLFPNQFQPDNRLHAGLPVEIAGPTTGARLTVNPPIGDRADQGDHLEQADQRRSGRAAFGRRAVPLRRRRRQDHDARPQRRRRSAPVE